MNIVQNYYYLIPVSKACMFLSKVSLSIAPTCCFMRFPSLSMNKVTGMPVMPYAYVEPPVVSKYTGKL